MFHLLFFVFCLCCDCIFTFQLSLISSKYCNAYYFLDKNNKYILYNRSFIIFARYQIQFHCVRYLTYFLQPKICG